MSENKFIKKYKKNMIKIMQRVNPEWDEDFIESTLNDMIQKNIKDPEVTLHNNYTNEMRNTKLLSVFNWVYDRKPIIAGNGTFYKNQYEAINPIARMLEGFLNKRKALKKEMFKIDDTNSPEYKMLDMGQSIQKVNANSYYGASGAKSSAFYSEYSGAATTISAQSVISTAQNLFEGFVADNYPFLDMTECIEWCQKVLKDFETDSFDDFICLKTVDEVANRLLDNIIDQTKHDEEFMLSYLADLTDEELSILYYKNNMQDFISDHEEIQDLIITIFESVNNFNYVDPKDEDWALKIDDNAVEEFYNEYKGKTAKDYNKFVNYQYFMDPNEPPKNIIGYLDLLKEYMMKYVYARYLAFDRIYRLKNFKRSVVTVIDTDSNILSLDTIVNFIFENIIRGRNFGRDLRNNEFILINILCYVLTAVVTDILLTYGEYSNIPEEYRPIYNMKNEFYFEILVIGSTKKRYISKIVLREGNLMNPPKSDVKGLNKDPMKMENYMKCWKLIKLLSAA